MLHDAKADVTAFADFPEAHWKKILEHQPVGAAQQRDQPTCTTSSDFPNPPALFRLAGAVLVEAHDEWQAGDRPYLSETSMAALTATATVLPTRDPEVVENLQLKTA